MATHSSILPWEIPWTEETGRLQSMGSAKSWTQLKRLGMPVLLTSFPILKQAFPLDSKHPSSLVFLPTLSAPSSFPQVLVHCVLITLSLSLSLSLTHTHTHTHTHTSSRDLALELWTHTSERLLNVSTLLSDSHANSANPQQNLGSFCHLLLSGYSGFS